MNNIEFDIYHKKYTYNITQDNKNNELWSPLISILEQDEHFCEAYERLCGYVACIYLMDGERNNDEDISESFSLITADNYDSINNKGICFKHIDYPINRKAKTFNELIDFEKETKKCPEMQCANSCFINIIMSTYKNAIENVYNNGKRQYKDLTLEYLCEILKIQRKDQDIGLSIRNSVAFFEKYKLGLVVVNFYDQVIFKYEPESITHKISPQTLYLLVYNSHCFKLNNNVNSFVQTLNNKNIHDESEINTYDELKNSLSTRFYFRNFEKELENERQFINSMDDTIQYILNSDKNIKFITNTPLEELLFEMINKHYTPNISICSGMIRSLHFKLEDRMFSIENGDSVMVENELMNINKEEYSNYYEADREIYEWLMNRDNLSQRNAYIRNIESQYPISPITGKFEHSSMVGLSNSIDFNKAYTSNLMDIEYFPVFNVFDVWLTYDNHEIEEYTQYIIECSDNIDTLILFGMKIARTYGYNIKRIYGIEYKILCYRRPSILKKCNGRERVTKLYNTTISTDSQEDIKLKKFIINKNLGIVEKKHNNKTIAKLFINRQEAQYYQIQYGGDIYPITNNTFSDNDNEWKIIETKKVYVLLNKVKKELNESFNPIKDLIYCIMRYKLWKLYKTLEEKNIMVHGIKTDCLLVQLDYNVIRNVVKLNTEIGGFKFQKDTFIPEKILKFKQNEIMNFELPAVNIIHMKDEYDANEINEICHTYDKVTVMSNIPGSGKTTAIKIVVMNCCS